MPEHTLNLAKSTQNTKSTQKTQSTKNHAALPEQTRLRLFRTMVLSRRLDDLEMQLKRQNKVFFQISCAGHEATLAAAALHLRAGSDWFFPYYRDRALCLGLGVSAEAMLLQAVGAASDPASKGRQMPSHWGDAGRHIVSQSSPTGTQFLNAVGCAEAAVHWRRMGFGKEQLDNEEGVVAPKEMVGAAAAQDEVVYVSSGEGTTSQGEFYEALNTACQARLPVIFHVEDNGYAISVPVESQTPGGSITPLLQGYPNLHRIEFDGCDPEASYRAWELAVAHARAKRGPVLAHAHVTRPYSHSMSDDERLYRTDSERKEQEARDPIVNYRAKLLASGISEATLQALEAEVDQELAAARIAATEAEAPKVSSVLEHVFSETFDPCSAKLAVDPAPSDAKDVTMVDGIRRCLHDAMQRDPRIVVFGEDVADASRPGAIEEVKGKGGVFKATAGLQRAFGDARVFNSPLAEANIVGRAVGLALRGIKPVVEVQFFDYIWTAMMQIRSELALLRWRSGGDWSCPVVIRAAYGGYLRGGSVYHSQTGESIFTHIPGLRVVMPSTALDAVGLLRTAILCEDPVLFLEHKHLYRQTHNRAPYPGEDYTIPLGKARTVCEGDDLTIITYGALVKRVADAAKKLAQEHGVQAHVLDLRSLQPYDWEAIAQSVQRTSRALVVHEDSRSWGFGAEIAARIGDELFEFLDAPIRRVTSMDTFVPYHPTLEDAVLPQIEDVVEAGLGLVGY